MLTWPGRTIGWFDESSTLSFSGTKSSTENSTLPTGGALGSTWAETVQRPRREDFGRATGWCSAPPAGRAWLKRVNSLPSGRFTISVTGTLASATAEASRSMAMSCTVSPGR